MASIPRKVLAQLLLSKGGASGFAAKVAAQAGPARLNAAAFDAEVGEGSAPGGSRAARRLGVLRGILGADSMFELPVQKYRVLATRPEEDLQPTSAETGFVHPEPAGTRYNT